jgi:fructoselysine 6-kinase
MKIACFSVAVMDFFPQQDKHFAGGNSLNQAIRYRQMGHQSAFVGALGTDEAGDRITALLRAESVDISHVHRINGRTASNQIINDDAGERYGVEGSWNGGVYDNFELGEADWEYINSFDVWSTHVNCPSYLSAVERKNKSQFMSVDFLHLKEYDLLEKSLRVVDIVYFGGTADMVDDLTRIAKINRGILVLTLGAEGSIAHWMRRCFSVRVYRNLLQHKGHPGILTGWRRVGQKSRIQLRRYSLGITQRQQIFTRHLTHP